VCTARLNLWPNDNQLEKAATFEEFLRNYVPHRAGYRLERGVLAHGDGTRVIQVGELKIGCIICADGSQKEAWQTFKREKPDLVFWQNNRGHMRDSLPQLAREFDVPIVATNRVGFSHHFFQLGGSCMVASDGVVVAKANEKGEEQMILANWRDLRR
jgi:predicted amidohydrolase